MARSAPPAHVLTRRATRWQAFAALTLACNGPRAVDVDSPTVRIRTADSVYTAAAPIQLTIENVGSTTYQYAQCPVRLQRQEGGAWRDVKNGVADPLACDAILLAAVPGQVRVLGQVRLVPDVGAGTYRLMSDAVTDSGGRLVAQDARASNAFRLE